VPPGEQAVLAVTLRAPPRAGRFRSYWRLVAPDGTRFGQRVWADVFVENSNASRLFAGLKAEREAKAAKAAEAAPSEQWERADHGAAAAAAAASASAADEPEAAVPHPKPSAPPSREGGDDGSASSHPHETVLGQLEAMGFRRDARLEAVVTEQGGNLQAVIEAMLGTA